MLLAQSALDMKRSDRSTEERQEARTFSEWLREKGKTSKKASEFIEHTLGTYLAHRQRTPAAANYVQDLRVWTQELQAYRTKQWDKDQYVRMAQHHEVPRALEIAGVHAKYCVQKKTDFSHIRSIRTALGNALQSFHSIAPYSTYSKRHKAYEATERALMECIKLGNVLSSPTP
jgi:hypothetical protein